MRPQACGPLLRILLIALGVGPVRGMEVVPYVHPTGTAVGILGTLGTFPWYTMSGTVMATAMHSTVEIAQALTAGVEDIVGEVDCFK